METQEKFYRFYYLNTITGETGHSVSKIPESDRQMWFEHLNRTEAPLAYWAEEVKGEGEAEKLNLDNDQQL